jgi:hypothetical protein
LDDAGPGFVLDDFQLGNIAVELPCVLSDKLVAFPDLDESQLLLLRGWHGGEGTTDLGLGIGLEEDGFEGLHLDCGDQNFGDQNLPAATMLCRSMSPLQLFPRCWKWLVGVSSGSGLDVSVVGH